MGSRASKVVSKEGQQGRASKGNRASRAAGDSRARANKPASRVSKVANRARVNKRASRANRVVSRARVNKVTANRQAAISRVASKADSTPAARGTAVTPAPVSEDPATAEPSGIR